MKKVVFSPKIDLVDISDINNNSIVGLQWEDGSKSWVVENYFNYVGFSVGDQSTKSKWDRKTKKEWCIEANKAGNTEIFVFDTEEELKKWLIEP